jgi:predicted transcriptional regulator
MGSITNRFLVCLLMTGYVKMFDSCSSPSCMKNNLYTLPLHKKYRGHFEIVALLLEAVKDNGATRFSIMRYSSTNYKQLEKYLDSLTEIGFIEMNKVENQCLYRATEKGLNFLRQYYALLGIFLSALAGNKPVNIAYETEHDSTAAQRQSATQLVTSLRHNLQLKVERQAEYPSR